MTAAIVEKLIEEHGPMTRAEAHRVLVRNFNAANLTPPEIARRIGITPDRVEQILDQLDGVPHEDDRAPSLEPIDGAPKVVRSQAIPSTGVPTPPSERRRRTSEHGTYSGYNKHAASKGRPGDWPRKPRDACAEARRVYQRDRHALRREIHADTPEEIRPYLKGAEIQCGTVKGYDRHKRQGEQPCEGCKEAWNAYRRDLCAQPAEPVAKAAPRVIGVREFGLITGTGVRAVSAETAKAAGRTVTAWGQVNP